MNDVVEINRRKVFLQHEVASLLPLIYRLTDEAQHEVKKIVNFIEAHSDKTSSAVHELEARLSDIVTR